jgi:bifunctional non-homologous end joining protein LigD
MAKLSPAMNGVASFDLVRHHRANDSVFLYAFDLIELNGDDLRRDPLEVRKVTLASILAKARPGVARELREQTART